jgi:hypothetical protein
MTITIQLGDKINVHLLSTLTFTGFTEARFYAWPWTLKNANDMSPALRKPMRKPSTAKLYRQVTSHFSVNSLQNDMGFYDPKYHCIWS